jgi:serine/threonine-protein kinase
MLIPALTKTPTVGKTEAENAASDPSPQISNPESPPVQVIAQKISEKDGMVLLPVPEGEFEMGSNDGESDEKPVHTVWLDAYWIDQTEVTNAMFAQFSDQTHYETDAEKIGYGYVFNESSKEWELMNGADWRHPRGPGSSVENQHPVVLVSWNDANVYCMWAGRRLPTEAEWEKAARGTDGRTYPWGNEYLAGPLLNFADGNFDIDSYNDTTIDDGYRYTAPVGSYPDGASPYGALDMAGNVLEWVADWYDPGYYNNSPDRNPSGPDSGDSRVSRGGSWSDSDYLNRSSIRLWVSPGNWRQDYGGFRCAASAAP